MTQQNPIGKMASGREAFGFSFKWWLFIFVAVLLPLDLIYRLGPLWIALPWYQIGINYASLVVFFALVALCIASASLVASLLLQLVIRQGTSIIKAANVVAGILFTFTSLLFYLIEWVKRIFDSFQFINSNLKYNIFYTLVILLILFIIIFYKKLSIHEKIIKICYYQLKIVAITVSCCLLVTVVVISHNIFNKFNATTESLTAHNKINLTNNPNIIIITFDALCTSHTSLYGFKRDTTPELVEFGRQSYVFNNMYSSGNWTLPSLTSLLTGKHPINTKMQNKFSFFNGGSQNENLPCILKEAGYETAASVSNEYGIPWKINLKGVDQVYSWMGGSEVINNFIKLCYISRITSGSWLLMLINESLLYRVADRWLERAWFGYFRMHHGGVNQPNYVTPEQSFEKGAEFLSHTRQPFFLWVHIIPPHAPYVPNDEFLYTFLPEKIFNNVNTFNRDIRKFIKIISYQAKDQPQVDKLSLRYDEHILYGDHEVGKFVSLLKETGVYEKSIVIVSADHGEMFEKGFWSHGGPYLYQCLIHVPLVIHLPGQSQGKRIEANASQVDLAPTILDFIGIEAPAWMNGKSFKKALHDPRFDTGTKFSMNLYEMNSAPNLKTPSIAAIHGDYKLIKYLAFNQYEMYDLRRDPDEKNNLVRLEPERFLTFKKEIDEFLAPQTPQ